ncbi:MAG: L,D-transpeptidase [Rhizobiales bacterium]|nr:L,D-transpeptidase [Hyphomicrobiales bacterium]
MLDPACFLSRRGFLSGATAAGAALALSGCTTVRERPVVAEAPRPPRPEIGEEYALMYAAVSDNGFDIPAVPFEKIDAQFLRQVVDDPTGEKPGTLIVDTATHHLYLVQPGGYAIRYGVGLGRAGFEWAGRAEIRWKQKWPKWTPPDEMIARDPSLAKWSADNGGMPGGLKNPLGARALYIFQGDQDTLYRVHGSPEWWSIGKSVSSGCVRMINQDVIDLYERVPQQSPIIVTNGLGNPVPDQPGELGEPIDNGLPTG